MVKMKKVEKLVSGMKQCCNVLRNRLGWKLKQRRRESVVPEVHEGLKCLSMRWHLLMVDALQLEKVSQASEVHLVDRGDHETVPTMMSVVEGHTQVVVKHVRNISLRSLNVARSLTRG